MDLFGYYVFSTGFERLYIVLNRTLVDVIDKFSFTMAGGRYIIKVITMRLSK